MVFVLIFIIISLVAVTTFYYHIENLIEKDREKREKAQEICNIKNANIEENWKKLKNFADKNDLDLVVTGDFYAHNPEVPRNIIKTYSCGLETEYSIEPDKLSHKKYTFDYYDNDGIYSLTINLMRLETKGPSIEKELIDIEKEL